MRKTPKKIITGEAQDIILYGIYVQMDNIKNNGHVEHCKDFDTCTPEECALIDKAILNRLQEYGDSFAKRWGMEDWHGFNKTR